MSASSSWDAAAFDASLRALRKPSSRRIAALVEAALADPKVTYKAVCAALERRCRKVPARRRLPLLYLLSALCLEANKRLGAGSALAERLQVSAVPLVELVCAHAGSLDNVARALLMWSEQGLFHADVVRRAEAVVEAAAAAAPEGVDGSGDTSSSGEDEERHGSGAAGARAAVEAPPRPKAWARPLKAPPPPPPPPPLSPPPPPPPPPLPLPPPPPPPMSHSRERHRRAPGERSRSRERVRERERSRERARARERSRERAPRSPQRQRSRERRHAHARGERSRSRERRRFQKERERGRRVATPTGDDEYDPFREHAGRAGGVQGEGARRASPTRRK